MLNSLIVYTVNCGFCWLIVILASGGYLLTVRRLRQKWPLWFVLAFGWLFLAVLNTLLVVGIPMDRTQQTAIWLSSYLLVMASLLLMFLKLADMMKRRS